MKNADDLLDEIVKVVDTNRDGKIQYEGRVYLPETRELSKH
jgi:hypothetical protein